MLQTDRHTDRQTDTHTYYKKDHVPCIVVKCLTMFMKIFSDKIFVMFFVIQWLFLCVHFELLPYTSQVYMIYYDLYVEAVVVCNRPEYS